MLAVSNIQWQTVPDSRSAHRKPSRCDFSLIPNVIITCSDIIWRKARIWYDVLIHTKSTCLSNNKWQSSVAPRLLISSAGLIWQPTTWTKGTSFMIPTPFLVPILMTSVFVGFRLSPLCVNHSSTAQLHLSSLSNGVMDDLGCTLMYNCVSSANWWNDSPNKAVTFATGAT